jgi:hypothetical protein
MKQILSGIAIVINIGVVVIVYLAGNGAWPNIALLILGCIGCGLNCGLFVIARREATNMTNVTNAANMYLWSHFT